MNYIQKFLEEHPLYEKITFSSSTYPTETHLHPILPASQAIIDSLIESDSKRIAIVFPDDNINILPLIVAKYLSNVQEKPEYAHSVFEDIQPGQHLKLGKSVVEFISVDKENKRIEFYAGKPTKHKYGSTVVIYPPIKYSTPIHSYYLYFERSNGALSKELTFVEERKKIRQKLEENGMVDIDLLALKRTVLNNTIAFLSPKNDFKDFLDAFYISGCKFQDVITYGEFDSEVESGARLYNTGKLDCLPGIIVSSKINEIAKGVSKGILKEKIDAIVVTQSKYNEAINNLGDFRKCLRTGIPLVMFVPEAEFETFPVLSEMGFEFWNWDPDMLDFGGFSSKRFAAPAGSMFSDLSKKVFNAATSEIALKTIKYSDLKQVSHTIRQLMKTTYEGGNPINRVARQMNKLVKQLIDMASPINGSIEKIISSQLDEISTLLSTLKPLYGSTDIWDEAETAFDVLTNIFLKAETPKSLALAELIMSSAYYTTIVLVPNRYAYIEELQDYLDFLYSGKEIRVLRVSDFYQIQSSTNEIQHLIVLFFDQAEYIKIKKTYCYKKLTYLLYTFENAWRRGFVNRYESCMQRESISKQARKIVSRRVKFAGWEPMDPEESSDGYEDVDEMSDYIFEKELVQNIIKRSNTSAEHSDSAECIPILFNQATIGYMSPNHNLIDITALCRGDLDKPVKKEAAKLVKGDIVLIRQSGKDIIYEKADELMKKRGELSLRKTTELWVVALRKFAEMKKLSTIKEKLNSHGAECNFNQIRYWLAGDTICPENRGVIEALSVLCPEFLPLGQVASVVNAGAKVQEYHREAGRWLTKELKYKAKDILDIYRSGNSEGHIDEIGDVRVYEIESVFEREFVDRNKMNKLEVII